MMDKRHDITSVKCVSLIEDICWKYQWGCDTERFDGYELKLLCHFLFEIINLLSCCSDWKHRFLPVSLKLWFVVSGLLALSLGCVCKY